MEDAKTVSVVTPKPIVHDPALSCFDVSAATPLPFCSFPRAAVGSWADASGHRTGVIGARPAAAQRSARSISTGDIP
ncbi:hypothetical protein [Paraburkholderia youngii]|uniref:hypothetical protein n=1 Tax=Paraburkholderia youngii TaxID=2782701 RepID=UPI003D1A28E5